LEFGIWYLEFGIWDLGFGIWDLEFGIWYLYIRKLRTKNSSIVNLKFPRLATTYLQPQNHTPIGLYLSADLCAYIEHSG
jgi:hypothetical protein